MKTVITIIDRKKYLDWEIKSGRKTRKGIIDQPLAVKFLREQIRWCRQS